MQSNSNNISGDDVILITGATGLVGSHLMAHLLKQGKKIRALYHSAIPPEGFDTVEWIHADILDVLDVEAAFEGIHQVYHCAGMVSFHPKQQKQLFQINVEGTANIVNAALQAGIQKMVFVSSVAALGRLNQTKPVTETTYWTEKNSNSIYGKSKHLAEMEIWRGIGEGLNAVIVNPVIILGASDWNKGSAAIFKSVYNEFPWYTEGVSGFVDVQDLVEVMSLLMDSDLNTQRFIVSAESIGYKELFFEIASNFNKKPPHKKVTPLMAEIVWRLEGIKGKISGKKPLLTKETARTAQAKTYFDNSKLLKELPGFHYRPLSDSIKRICEEFTIKYQLK